MSTIYILYITSTADVMMSPWRQSLLTKRMLGFISAWNMKRRKVVRNPNQPLRVTAPEGKLRGDAQLKNFRFYCCGMHQMRPEFIGNQPKQFSQSLNTLHFSELGSIACIFGKGLQAASESVSARSHKMGIQHVGLSDKMLTSWRKNQWWMKRGHVRNCVRNTYGKRCSIS